MIYCRISEGGADSTSRWNCPSASLFCITVNITVTLAFDQLGRAHIECLSLDASKETWDSANCIVIGKFRAPGSNISSQVTIQCQCTEASVYKVPNQFCFYWYVELQYLMPSMYLQIFASLIPPSKPEILHLVVGISTKYRFQYVAAILISLVFFTVTTLAALVLHNVHDALFHVLEKQANDHTLDCDNSIMLRQLSEKPENGYDLNAWIILSFPRIPDLLKRRQSVQSPEASELCSESELVSTFFTEISDDNMSATQLQSILFVHSTSTRSVNNAEAHLLWPIKRMRDQIQNLYKYSPQPQLQADSRGNCATDHLSSPYTHQLYHRNGITSSLIAETERHDKFSSDTTFQSSARRECLTTGLPTFLPEMTEAYISKRQYTSSIIQHTSLNSNQKSESRRSAIFTEDMLAELIDDSDSPFREQVESEILPQAHKDLSGYC